MSGDAQNFSPFEKEMIKLEMFEGLRHALDKNFRRLLESAKKDWERLFAGKDPSDACVNVRITAADADAKALPGSGFLKSKKPSETKTPSKLPQRRLAH